MHAQIVTHLCIVHGPGCLTSVIWPFTLTALTFVPYYLDKAQNVIPVERYIASIFMTSKMYCIRQSSLEMNIWGSGARNFHNFLTETIKQK